MTEDRADEETIGQRVRRLRLSRRLSQAAISGPGVSEAHISRIESGERKPSLKALRFLAGKLGVDHEYLESGTAIAPTKERELRLANAELELRLGDDLDRAEDLLRGLLDEDVPDGIEARVRATLGGIASRRGDHHEAIRQLESVIASGAVRPDTRPDVYETLSRSYLATGAPVMAVKLLEGCISEVDREEHYVTQQVRYRTFLATTLASMGAVERASSVLEKATQRAEQLGGIRDRVATYWEQARLAWMRGDPDTALAAIASARAFATIADDTLEVARSHLLSAQIYNYEGRPAEARPHLERAEQMLCFGDDAVDRGLLRCEQAICDARLGHGESALARAHEAVELLIDHVRHVANARHALAAAYAALGDVDAADVEYRGAVEALIAREQWREAASLSREWAKTLRDAGRKDRAYAVLEQASTFNQRVGAKLEFA